MFASDDCLPTPLFSPAKNPFADFSDTDSVSCDGKTMSRNGSFTDLRALNDKEILTSCSYKVSTTYTSSFRVTIQELETDVYFYADDEESHFPEELYDRIDEFLDEEGLNITSPSPFLRCRRAKPSMTVILTTSFAAKSEMSTTFEGDSPFSDNQAFSAPAFLIRRSISGGFNKSPNLLASQFRSEHLLEANSPPSFGFSNFKSFQCEMKVSESKEETVIEELQ